MTTLTSSARFIQDKLQIINKNGEEVAFVLNPIQSQFVNHDLTGRDVVLKARQQGFSSVILGLFTKDFLLKPNSVNVVVADIAENATALLDRVKYYLRVYADKNKFNLKDLLKYNSKYQLTNLINNSQYIIGTATNADFGRSRTITNLHLSEFAFYPDAERLLAGAMQAVTPNGRVIIETTANGFNYFKDYWDRTELGETGFVNHFYPASKFYDEKFLAQKKKELGRMYPQEYPETPIEAFIASGDYYFDNEALKYYLTEVENVQEIPQL